MTARSPEAERLVKRFYKQAGIAPVDGEETAPAYAVVLDGRPMRTPARAPFQVPVEALAGAIAQEWQDQEEKIRPETMPLTQIAGTAIDKVAPGIAQVRADTLAYAETDLLCYRAETPADLAVRQAEAWQPVLEWLARTHGAPLRATTTIIAIDQPPESLAALDRCLAGLDVFRLTAVSLLTGALGSLGLALAVSHGEISPKAAWEAAFLDELWQARRWGDDHEASVRRHAMLQDVESAARFFSLAGQ